MITTEDFIQAILDYYETELEEDETPEERLESYSATAGSKRPNHWRISISEIYKALKFYWLIDDKKW